MLQSLFGIRPTDILDVVIVALLLGAGIAWFRRTRARLALIGLGIIGVVYLAARQLELQMTVWMLQGFFAVFALVLIVVFQEDLRRFFEQIALWGLRRRRALAPPQSVADEIVRVAARLAETGTGALIVLPGREPLDRHVDGGVPLGGQVSETLLYSLFDPHSPGHDGAILISGTTVDRFAVHLPLSGERGQLGDMVGTRHAAALGLSERCDALCIVVSEERSTVSVARRGRLRALDRPEELSAEISRFLEDTAPSLDGPRPRLHSFLRLWREALMGLLLALLFWLVLIPGGRPAQWSREAPVIVENLPTGYLLHRVEPEVVTVTVSGRTRDALFRRGWSPRARLDAGELEAGSNRIRLEPRSVDVPEELSVIALSPHEVVLEIRPEGPKGGPREAGEETGDNPPPP